MAIRTLLQFNWLVCCYLIGRELTSSLHDCFKVQNKIVLSRLTHDISELRWRLEEAKLKLTGELKVFHTFLSFVMRSVTFWDEVLRRFVFCGEAAHASAE